ncbi:MAG TPA: ABC transporter transmembrane domain-containing protein, partial [Candidatus Saccharimonadia bacterium]|nr:ABC transporter transmembrane domain-containing protein [Candidatus Saccharimonadia bacterium]
MFGLIARLRAQVWGTVALNTALGLGAVVPPFLLKVILDKLSTAARHGSPTAASVRLIVLVLGGMLVLRLMLAAASYVQERLSDILRIEAIIEVRQKLFTHVLGLSVDYYETHQAGEIVDRITQGVYEFGMWLQN